MKAYILPVKDKDPSAAVNEMLKGLLSSGEVSSVLALQETPSGKSAFPTMISDPEKLSSNVFAPILPVSTGTMVSKMTRVRASPEPVAVVLRACEMRALTELIKLNQADLANIITIGVDCHGTVPINTYSNYPGEKKPTDAVLGGEEKHLRTACLSCKDPVPSNTDLIIGTFGAEMKKELYIISNTEAGEKIMSGLDLKEAKDLKNREKAIEDIRNKKDKYRSKHIEEHSDIKGIDKVAEFFDTCVNCHNCMKACPICYCKECLFESSVFDLEGSKYVNKAKHRGAFKTPPDSLLFHITRFNHMILSCVECGLCEQACPSNIPLMDIIIPVAENAQDEFKYLPGRDPEEEMPMVVYREDEYEEVGE